MEIESAWPKYPDYRIELIPVKETARVWFGDLLLAESSSCLRLEETKHVDRLYFPESDVRWEHFEVAEDIHTVCPFKGMADYWNLTAVDPVETNFVWTYREPFDEVAGIKGYVCFYQERTRIEIEECWPDDDPRAARQLRFPLWGEAKDLLQLIDVDEVDEEKPGRFFGAPYPTGRNVVEGGQMLAQGIVAASKTAPGQRVTSGYMIFSRAAAFDAPLDIDAELLRGGRSFSTVEVRISQDDKFRSAGLYLLDAGAPETINGSIAMPDVPGPYESPYLDMSVSGRDLRVVNGAYDDNDTEKVGPPEIYVWCRFRDDPGEPYLHAALLAQSTTHWTIAAAMLPHPGVCQAQAHVTLSTGIMSTSIAFHDDFNVTDWLLYANPAIYAGKGLAQGEGHVFTQGGRLVASYTVQAIIRPFNQTPEQMGLDASNAM